MKKITVSINQDEVPAFLLSLSANRISNYSIDDDPNNEGMKQVSFKAEVAVLFWVGVKFGIEKER